MKNFPYRILFVFLSILSSLAGLAQSRFIDQHGNASFYSEAPVEDIEAHSKEAMSIIDLETGEIVASISMKSFVFKKSLMQEHFNENYVESHKYPNATFKGEILDVQALDFLKNGTYHLDIAGEITIHGVTRPLECKAKFVKKEEGFTAATRFPIKVADFDIKIPKIVFYNIAEVVDVKISFSYQPLNPQ